MRCSDLKAMYAHERRKLSLSSTGEIIAAIFGAPAVITSDLSKTIVLSLVALSTVSGASIIIPAAAERQRAYAVHSYSEANADAGMIAIISIAPLLIDMT